MMFQHLLPWFAQTRPNTLHSHELFVNFVIPELHVHPRVQVSQFSATNNASGDDGRQIVKTHWP